MARLIHPTVGTVVTLEGDLEESYLASGWLDAEQEQAASDKPAKRPAGRPRKTSN